jgi:outer membrane protein assembly factor BamB
MNTPAVFLGINGNVFSLDRTTGQELWAIDLKGTGFVNLLVDRDLVIATTHGEAWALDPVTGSVLWHNNLEGQGLGLVSIATANGASNVVTMEQRRQEEQAATTMHTTNPAGGTY